MSCLLLNDRKVPHAEQRFSEHRAIVYAVRMRRRRVVTAAERTDDDGDTGSDDVSIYVADPG
jgi:hypothetical protein